MRHCHAATKRDYRNARKHAEFDAETLEYVFDADAWPPACKLLCPSVSESDGGGSALLDEHPGRSRQVESASRAARTQGAGAPPVAKNSPGPSIPLWVLLVSIMSKMLS